jgi:L-threonylcarbamoyladenylate synthase
LKEYREIRLDPRDPLVWEPGVSAAVEALEEGGVLVHPTSTVYGIGAAATKELNAEINRLKGRPPNRSLIRLAGSVEVLRRELPEAAWEERADKLATEFWPGPLTLILDDGSDDGLAVRVDGHPILLVVLGRWRSLMTAGSLPASTSSTVVSVRGKTTEILRRGPIDRRRIARCLGETP